MTNEDESLLMYGCPTITAMTAQYLLYSNEIRDPQALLYQDMDPDENVIKHLLSQQSTDWLNLLKIQNST